MEKSGRKIYENHQKLVRKSIQKVIEKLIDFGIDFLMTKTSYHGVLNLVSPHPISLSDLMRQLCSLLHRPLLFRIPSFFFRFIFKEAASFFIKGHFVSCHQLLSLGYQFHHLNINQWIDAYLGKKT